MTRHEWLTSEDPQAMLAVLSGRNAAGLSVPFVTGHLPPDGKSYVSDRKLQLWMKAVAKIARRPVDDPDANTQQHLTLPLRWATAKHAKITFGEKAAILRDMIGDPFDPVTLPLDVTCIGCDGAGVCGSSTGRRRGAGGQVIARSQLCRACGGKGYLCSWLTPTVLSLASAAYEQRQDNGMLDPFRLALVADALEDAGASDGSLLRHLRRQWCWRCAAGFDDADPAEALAEVVHECQPGGPLCRGAWSLDCVLGLS